MFKCVNCGAELDKLKTGYEQIGEAWGKPIYSYWENDICPVCGDQMEEAVQCKSCGCYYTEDEITAGYNICKKCLNDMMTVRNSIDYGKDSDKWESVNINPFLAYIYTSEEINRILEVHMLVTKSANKKDAEEFWWGEESELIEFMNNKKEEK